MVARHDSDTAAAVLHGSARFPLDQDGLIRASGGEAAAFLHGQFSSDVKGMAPGEARLTAYSDARGRVLAVPLVIARESDLLLAMPRERTEPIRATLAKYVLRADVRLEEVSGELRRFGVAGQSASVALAGAAGSLPQAVGSSVTAPGGAVVVRLRGPRPRFLVHGDPEGVDALWHALDGHAHDASGADWRLLEIEAGVPTVLDATAGHFVAQMLNLDRLGAIDFGKGCYPGQEVIARTHYLGRIKRRMFVLRGDSGSAPAPGDSVYADGDAVGECVVAADHPDGGSLALAVLRTEAPERTLHLGAADGPAASAAEPPYALEEEAA